MMADEKWKLIMLRLLIKYIQNVTCRIKMSGKQIIISSTPYVMYKYAIKT